MRETKARTSIPVIQKRSAEIESPLDPEVIERLRIGDRVLISGIIYVARDAAHSRMVECLNEGRELPFDIVGQTIYYSAPSPAKPGHVIGSAGPTTSGRMDTHTPPLIAVGLRAMIGKGKRSARVVEAMNKYKAVYFVATGGAGALIAKSIKRVEIVGYEDLGVEEILRIEVKDFPATVGNDIYGGDIYEKGRAKYQT